jgi:hypothetical protein
MKKRMLLSIAMLSIIDMQAQNWSIFGNAGTTPANFIGTTDPAPLRLRVNNFHAGQVEFGLPTYGANVSYGVKALGVNIGLSNTAIGSWSMSSNSTGSGNTSLGDLSLSGNTSGSQNVAIGSYALVSNNGNNNVAVGVASLVVNSLGNNNVAMNSSLQSNNTGSNNIAIGWHAVNAAAEVDNQVAVGTEALMSNVMGTESTAIGHQALRMNTASYNTAVGFRSLTSNIDGHSNVAVGGEAMPAHVNGYENVAVGHKAMLNSIHGNRNVAIGMGARYTNVGSCCDVAIGFNALYTEMGGAGHNVAIGYDAMYLTTTGSGNVAVGQSAFWANTAGTNNIAVGTRALQFNTTGQVNTAVGYEAGAVSSNLHNTIAIGNSAYAMSSDYAVIGNSVMATIGGYQDWTNYSDARYKKNIKQNVPGLEFINKLNPVTYVLDVRGIDKHIDEVTQKNFPDSSRKVIRDDAYYDKAIATKMVHTGFLAQEVEKAAEEIGYDFSGVDKPRNEDALYGLRYGEFVPPLVKAVQEQQLQIEALATQNEELSMTNAELVKRLEKLEAMANVTTHTDTKENAGTQLAQNVPNPFSAQTTIHYVLAESGKVVVELFSAKGDRIKELENANKDKGSYSIELSGDGLQSGMYYYTLSLNGKRLVKKAIKL